MQGSQSVDLVIQIAYQKSQREGTAGVGIPRRRKRLAGFRSVEFDSSVTAREPDDLPSFGCTLFFEDRASQGHFVEATGLQEIGGLNRYVVQPDSDWV